MSFSLCFLNSAELKHTHSDVEHPRISDTAVIKDYFFSSMHDSLLLLRLSNLEYNFKKSKNI